MAQSTLENGKKVAGFLSVLVTWKMNFLCIFSIFCDFESKVQKSIYARKMSKKAWSSGCFSKTPNYKVTHLDIFRFVKYFQVTHIKTTFNKQIKS